MPHRITTAYVSKDSHIIVRVESELRQRLERLALLERREMSDLCRLVFEDYLNAMERKLGLSGFALHDSAPSSFPAHQAGQQIVSAAGAHALGATSAPPPPAKPVKYKVARGSKKKPAA